MLSEDVRGDEGKGRVECVSYTKCGGEVVEGSSTEVNVHGIGVQATEWTFLCDSFASARAREMKERILGEKRDK